MNAEDAEGNTVSNSDPTEVVVVSPSITIDKDDNDNNDDTQTVLTGGTSTFTITVTNDGDVDLVNVEVSDPTTPDCDQIIGNLAAGDSVTYTCTTSGETSDFTSTAEVSAEDASGNPTSDSDPTDVVVIDPSIEIVKDPPTQVVAAGQDATFNITVTNTGDATLTAVEVTDALTPDCAGVIGTLAAGESTSYTCSLTNVTAAFTNNAAVTGTPPVGPPVSDDDDADVTVINPAIEIIKSTSTPQILSGDTATFGIMVTNIGDVDLVDVEVTDPLAPDCDTVIGPLAVGDFVAYTCTLTNVTNDLTNVATATGSHPDSPDVSDTDDAEVDVIGPSILIEKTPDNQTVESGSDVTFTITVTNTGDAELTNVEVSDPVTPDCNSTIGTLSVGEVVSYECTFANAIADFVNTATATGTPPIGPDVSDSDNANVDVIVNGTIIVNKSLASGTEPLTSFCFTLSPDPGIGEICANSSGEAVFNDVPEGTYFVVETTSSGFYRIVSTDCFDLIIANQNDQISCNITNGLSQSLAGIETPPLGGGGTAEDGDRIIINEIQYQGTSASPDDEWIELFNTSARDIDLTGWTLVWGDPEDNDGEIVQLFGTISGNGFYVLERKRERTVSDLRADLIYDGVLSDGGEQMFLINPAGDTVDTANRNGGPWPAGTGALGTPAFATMERVDPFAPDTDENWKTNDGITRYGLTADGEPINGTRKAPNSAQDATKYELGDEIGLAFQLNDAEGEPVLDATPALTINKVTSVNGEETIEPMLNLPDGAVEFRFLPETAEYQFIIDTQILGLGFFDLWITLDGDTPRRVMRIEVVESL